MPQITVLGSLMLDVVIRVARLPAVGETLFGDSVELFVGGKGGNQAVAAARLGASFVEMIGRVGVDPFGDRILASLKADGVGCSHVERDPVAGTGMAVPFVYPDGANSIISLPRANFAMTVEQVRRAAPAIESASMLVLQLEVSPEANLEAALIASAAGVPVLLNTAPVGDVPTALWPLVDWIVANEVEAGAFAPGLDGPLRQAEALAARARAGAVVTLGGEGAIVAVAGNLDEIPAFPVVAIDTVGAGDAFCGAFALALQEGRSPGEAARFACAAGAVAVTRPGAAASLPTRAEVLALLNRP